VTQIQNSLSAAGEEKEEEEVLLTADNKLQKVGNHNGSLSLSLSRSLSLAQSAQGGVTRQGVVLTYLLSFVIDSR